MDTHHLSFILLLPSLIFFFSSLPSPSLVAAAHRCNPDDYKVLMQIKNSLNNPYHLASWVPKTDCCHWYCLQCDRTTNRVSELTIFSGNISGQIPSSIGYLPYLHTLVFRKLTNITGSIPSSIVKLKNLKMLQLDRNNLSGPIPDFLGKISSLTDLDLSFNQFSGSIPSSIVKLKNLKTLQLDWNILSGPIPDFLSRITTLTYLDLSYNQFSGSIPSSLSNLNNLGALYLEGNKLTGSIPESFGKFNSPAASLVLSDNQLSGPIPKSLRKANFDTIDLSKNKLEGDGSFLINPRGAIYQLDLSWNRLEFDLTNVRFPVNMTYLDLSHNRIRGIIPEQMKKVDLYRFNVSYNRLCGEIPFGGKLQSFDYSCYFHNKCLCGSPLGACKKNVSDATIT